VELGAGRRRLEDEVDPAVGIELLARRGDRIERGEAVAVIHARSENSAASAARRLGKAYGFGDVPPEDPPLVWKRVTTD
jgi:thymidine phosphorylase